jgi:hypothetical protein
MGKASPIISALNAGEWSPLLSARVDIAGYSASAYRCENFIPLVQGPVTRRGGTAYVNQTKSGKAWLVPFVKARNDAWQVEFGNGYCRFFTQRAPVLTGTTKTITGITQASPAVVSSTAHGFVNGDDVFLTGVVGMTQVNGRWFKVANKTDDTFELTTIHGDDVDSTAYGAYTSGGTADKPYQIVSPFTDLETDRGEFALDVVQTGDVLYITDRLGVLAPRKLSRFGATDWQFSTLNPDTGPYEAINASATTVYVSGATGTITITASTSIFTAADVGRLFRIDQETLTATDPWVTGTSYSSGTFVRSEGKEYESVGGGASGNVIPSHTSGTASDGSKDWIFRTAGYGVARITAQSGTTATATVLTRFPQTIIGSGNASTIWRRGAWYADNYPTCVTFYRERLAFAGRQRVDLSVAASFEDFSPDSFGEVLPESAISTTVQSGAANDIVGMQEGKALMIATAGGEFVLDAASTSEPLGPNNVRISGETAFGARPIRPIRVGENVLVIQSSGRRLRSFQFSFDVDGFIAPDMTVRSEHIVKPSVIAMARQESPYQTIWLVRSDGVLLSFAFDQTQEVRAWARHVIGGTDAKVESLSVIPSPDGARDDLWLTVSRTINGATRRYIEYVTPEYEAGDDVDGVTYGDALLSFAPSGLVLYGLDHLEGETVGALIDGASAPDVEVTAGQVTLPRAGDAVQIGYRYASIYATQTIEAGAGDGTAQAKTKRITDCAFRVIDTLGGGAGPDLANLDDVPDLNYRAPSTPMGQAPAFFTGDALLSWQGGYETAGRIWYRNDTMFPATIAAIMPQVTTQESR